MAAAAKKWLHPATQHPPPSPLALGVSLSLTYLLQFLVIPEQGKGAQHQLPVQLPGATGICKGDAFSLV